MVSKAPIGVTQTDEPRSVQDKRAQFGKGVLILLVVFAAMMFCIYSGIITYALSDV
jgi:hypothetical protein